MLVSGVEIAEAAIVAIDKFRRRQGRTFYAGLAVLGALYVLCVTWMALYACTIGVVRRRRSFRPVCEFLDAMPHPAWAGLAPGGAGGAAAAAARLHPGTTGAQCMASPGPGRCSYDPVSDLTAAMYEY